MDESNGGAHDKILSQSVIGQKLLGLGKKGTNKAFESLEASSFMLIGRGTISKERLGIAVATSQWITQTMLQGLGDGG